MPKRKINQEQFHNKPAPEYWANEPEQFIYQKGELLIFQKDFDSLPTITISRVQLLEDANNVRSWVNDNSLTGGWDKWNKIIGHSLIELMKIPVLTDGVFIYPPFSHTLPLLVTFIQTSTIKTSANFNKNST